MPIFRNHRAITLLSSLFLAGFSAHAFFDFSQDELKALHDPGGWEYVTISDVDSGIQTTHTCFDGRPHPQACAGKLILNADNSFVQSVYIHGQTVQRHGKYELNDDQIAFFDELGTRDGPYTVGLDLKAKSLALDMPQVHVELLLEKEYRDRQRVQNKAPHGS